MTNDSNASVNRLRKACSGVNSSEPMARVLKSDITNLLKVMNSAQAEARELRTQMERVRQITLGMHEYVDSCTHPSEMSKGNAVGYWHAQLVIALSLPAAEQLDDWPESRIDVIGQNGNDGHHYAGAERGQEGRK